MSQHKSDLEQSGPEKAFEGGLYDSSFITDFVLWITIRYLHELILTKKTQLLARCMKSELGNLNKHYSLDKLYPPTKAEVNKHSVSKLLMRWYR